MPIPKSVIKIKKDGVEYVSEVDKANYYIEELSRAALKDVGKFVTRRARDAMAHHKQSGRLRKNIQHWVRKNEVDLQVGYKPQGFYGGFFEIGAEGVPKEAPIYNAVADNIPEIQKIEAQYLSAIEDELKAKGLIDESEEIGDD